MDSLERQIIEAMPQKADRINRIRFGSIEMVVQDGKLIRFEYHEKDNVIQKA